MSRRFSFKVLPSLVTLLAFSIMCKLGFWQLDRAEQKEQEIMAFSQMAIIESDNLQEMAKQDIAGLHGRKIRLSGTVDQSHAWLIDNKTHMGQVGYSLAVKMFPNSSVSSNQDARQGNSEELALLVDLGWIAGGMYREQLPSITLPNQISVVATLKSQNFGQIVLGNNEDENHTSTTNEQRLERVQSYKEIFQLDKNALMPLVAFAESNSFSDMPQLYKPVVMPPEKHVAYAVQWFLLGIASLVVFGLASLNKSNVKQMTSET